jgi:two-component sensor histidine kinase
MRELTHRSKNLLAVIQAMARQTARHAGTVDRFLQRFGERLQALARSHDLLVQESWHGASLDDLVRSQLGAYLDRKNSQVTVEGEDVQLKPEAAQSLGLALHELATNAAKYGALSRVRGRVHIAWKRRPPDRGGALELRWTESKGPKVSGPKRRGFGSMVIEHNLVRAIEAEVSLTFEPEGLKCRIVVPEAHLLGEREAAER